MLVTQNQSLRPYNTFNIQALAEHFAECHSVEDFSEILSDKTYSNKKLLVLGGGSNILFRNDVNGLVLRNQLKGITLAGEDDKHYYVKAAAGEVWHSFVLHCIENNFCGLENLSLIPGNVGASPMQNIGAYGVEIKDVFHELEALHVKEKYLRTFTSEECEFGYRESIFKRKLREQFIITSVTFRLNKTPRLNTSYGAIGKELENMRITEPGIRDVSNAVIRIRTSKLPDPKVLGNAGSFFKNPEVPAAHFHSLKKDHENIVGYEVGNGNIKLAAGWLIESCGWKGFREGDAGVHKDQALVLVNYKDASGDQVYDLSQKVMDSVQNKFGVQLEREVNII